jgi:hypothetical protein
VQSDGLPHGKLLLGKRRPPTRMMENYDIENDVFIKLSKRSLSTLENLIKNEKVERPIEPQVMLDIAIGTLAESQMSGQVDMIEIFHDHPEFIFDNLYFEQPGEYNLHDVLAQVICYRLISMMHEFLEHINVEYVNIFDED